MNLQALLKELKKANVTLKLKNDKPILVPKESCTPEIIEAAKANLPALIEHFFPKPSTQLLLPLPVADAVQVLDEDVRVKDKSKKSSIKSAYWTATKEDVAVLIRLRDSRRLWTLSEPGRLASHWFIHDHILSFTRYKDLGVQSESDAKRLQNIISEYKDCPYLKYIEYMWDHYFDYKDWAKNIAFKDMFDKFVNPNGKHLLAQVVGTAFFLPAPMDQPPEEYGIADGIEREHSWLVPVDGMGIVDPLYKIHPNAIFGYKGVHLL